MAGRDEGIAPSFFERTFELESDATRDEGNLGIWPQLDAIIVHLFPNLVCLFAHISVKREKGEEVPMFLCLSLLLCSFLPPMNYGIAIYVEIYGDSLSFLHMKSHVVELFAPSCSLICACNVI